MEDILRLPTKKALEDKRNLKRRKRPSVNAIGERVNEGRVLNDEARLEILQHHDTQVEEEILGCGDSKKYIYCRFGRVSERPC